MPRKRTALRKNGKHTKDQMQMALSFIAAGTSIRKAAQAIGISHNTVRRYFQKVQNCDSPNDVSLTPNYANRYVFTEQEEECLKSHIRHCAEIFYGVTSFDCRKLAFQFAISKNKTSLRDTWHNNSMAGLDWLRGFRKRHPDVELKKFVPPSVIRTTLLDKHLVETYFDKLCSVLESFSNPTRIYNLDEFVTTMVQQSESQKILALQNEAIDNKTASEGKEESVTICCIVSATGQVLPPVIVFPQKQFESHMLHGAPTESLGLANPSGTMKPELFLNAMKHFIETSNSSPTNPCLLIIDNDESHYALEALQLAKNSGVRILACPPYSMTMLQPLEVGVFEAFKESYVDTMNSFIVRNPGQKVTANNVAQIIGHAFSKALTPARIINAFKKTGIIPFDRNFLPEAIFLKPPLNQQNTSLAAASENIIEKSTTEDQHLNCSKNMSQDLCFRTTPFAQVKDGDRNNSQDLLQPNSTSNAQNRPAELDTIEQEDNIETFVDVDATTQPSLYSSYNDSNTMQSGNESENSGERLFKSMVPQSEQTSNSEDLPNKTDARSLDPSDVDIKFEPEDCSLLKEEVDLDSVSEMSEMPFHWKTETEPQYHFNNNEDQEEDADEQYDDKSFVDLKRIALISQTKMYKAQEAAARAIEKLSLYKLEILKRRNGDIL